MRLSKKQKQILERVGTIKSHLPHDRGGVYELKIGNETTYFIVLKRNDVKDCNFTSLIFKDEIMYNKLIKLKCSGNYFKKVLFVVGNRFHWYRL